MARSRDVSPVPIPMDDIGFERLTQHFELGGVGIADAHDGRHSPSKPPWYRVVGHESVLDKDGPGQNNFLIPRKPLPNAPKSDNSNGTAVQAHIAWLYPTIMLATLLAGLGLAIGHHSYYRWLDGRLVGSAAKQQWSLR
jgi:hypothetical protein